MGLSLHYNTTSPIRSWGWSINGPLYGVLFALRKLNHFAQLRELQSLHDFAAMGGAGGTLRNVLQQTVDVKPSIPRPGPAETGKWSQAGSRTVLSISRRRCAGNGNSESPNFGPVAKSSRRGVLLRVFRHISLP
jgi:hypothetical protein